MQKYLPPRASGLAPQSQVVSSYTGRHGKDDNSKGIGGEKDEQGSLDFISSMIKREVLSSPKTS